MASKVVFRADTQQFDEPVKRSGNEVRALQAELRKLETTAKQSFQEQRLAAKAAGASTEELRKLDQAYAREQLALNSTRKQISAESITGSREQVTAEESKRRAIELTTKAYERQRQAVEKLPTGGGSHYEPTDRQKVGALVRAGSGNPGIRAGESFLASLPGAAAIADFAFPIAGIVALGAEVVKGIEKFVKLRQEARDTAQAIRERFEGINAPIETSADTLRKANAELGISISLLEHKPANTLALSAAEAALEVDHLAERARAAYNDVKKLLDEQRVGYFNSLVTDQGTTAEAANLTQGGFRDIADRTRDEKNAVRKYGPDSEEAKAAKKALDDRKERLRSDLSEYNRKINGTEDVEQTGAYGTKTRVRLSYQQAHGDQTANRQIVSGALDILDNQDDEDTQRKQNGILTAQQKRAELKKQRDKDAGEAARKALEGQRKAAAEQRQQWDDDHAAFDAAGNRSAADEARFWNDRANEAVFGSDNYRAASKKADEAVKKANEERLKLFSEGLKLQRELNPQYRAGLEGGALASSGNAYAKGQSEAAKINIEMVEQQAKARNELALANVQYDVQAGRISKLDAAVQTAALHQKQYNEQLAYLREQRAAVQSGPDADPQRGKIDQQINAATDSRNIQSIQDNANIQADTLLGALKRTNALWVQDSQDSAKVLAQVYGGLLDGVNADLTTSISRLGERGNHHPGRDLRNALGGTVRGVGGEVLNAGLRHAEGGLLGKLGLGKADGSKGNPLNVFVVNGADGKKTDSLLPSSADVRNLIPGGSGAGNDMANGVVSAALSFLPGGSLLSGIFGGARAMGGGVDAGKAYLVGENGPELFAPGATGHISTASRTSAMMSGNTHNWDIDVDARGAHDPAAVRAQVQKGIADAAPRIIVAAHAYTKDQNRRGPTSART